MCHFKYMYLYIYIYMCLYKYIYIYIYSYADMLTFFLTYPLTIYLVSLLTFVF